VAVLCALETEGLASPVLSDLPDPGDSTRAVVQGAADLGELDLRLTAALLTAADALRSGQMHPDSLFSAWHVAAPEAISDTAAAALLAGSLGWAWPGGLNLAVVQRSPGAPAWAVGVMMTGLFVGAVGGPLLTGFLAEHDLFTLAWIACAGLALLAAGTIAATLRRERVAKPGSPGSGSVR
jgi:hypothetical protein